MSARRGDIRQIMPPAVSVLLPAYNAASTLDAALASMRRQTFTDFELVVVDDGSTDATTTIVESMTAEWPSFSTLRILRHKANRGKGAAVRTGMIAARGTHRVFTDADLAYGFEPVALLRRALDNGADVAAGVRERHRGGLRRLAGWAFGRCVAAYGLAVGPDPQCGIKAFTAGAAGMLFGVARVDGFAFDVEVLHLASRWGLDVARVPVVERGGVRHSSVDFLHDTPLMLRSLREIRATTEAGAYEDNGPKPRYRKGLETDA